MKKSSKALRLSRKRKRERRKKLQCPYCRGKKLIRTGTPIPTFSEWRSCPACGGAGTLVAASARILAGEFDPTPYCHKFCRIEDWCDFRVNSLNSGTFQHDCSAHWWQVSKKSLGTMPIPD